MTIWRMGIACWIPKATDTHLEYVIVIVFPQQQLLHERAPMLRFYLRCLLRLTHGPKHVENRNKRI